MKFFVGLCAVLVLAKCCFAVDCNSSQMDSESKVKRQIFCGKYDKTMRPSINGTTIRLKMVVKSFDYSDGVIKVNSWMVMNWNDGRLKWNPQDYQNMKAVYEISSSLWIPDLSLYNEDIGLSDSTCKDANCIVKSSGNVVCILPCSYNGHCDPDYRQWPYDRQTCKLMFGSWIHTGEEMNFLAANTTLDTAESKVNLDWNLIAAASKRHPGNYPCCPNQTYPSIIFSFIMERHSASLAATILVPALLMIFLNWLAFLLHFTSSERFIVICLNTFAHFTFLQQLSWHVPQNGDSLPNIIVFCRDSLFLTGFAGIFSVCLRILAARQGPGPEWLANVHNALVRYSVYAYLGVTSEPVTVTGNQIEKVENEQQDGDGVVLVEMKQAEVSCKGTESIWSTLAHFIDRICLVVYVLTYVILIVRFVPEGYDNVTDMTPLTVEKV